MYLYSYSFVYLIIQVFTYLIQTRLHRTHAHSQEMYLLLFVCAEFVFEKWRLEDCGPIKHTLCLPHVCNITIS